MPAPPPRPEQSRRTGLLGGGVGRAARARRTRARLRQAEGRDGLRRRACVRGPRATPGPPRRTCRAR